MHDPLMIACALAAVAMLGYFVWTLIAGAEKGKLRTRLRSDEAGQPNQPQTAMALKQVFWRIGRAISSPFMPSTRERQSKLQNQLARAGIYSSNAMRAVQGCKFIGLALGLIGGYVAGLYIGGWMGLPVGGLIGYLAPSLWLRGTINTNQKSLDYGLADALDLMVVCVEAGLTIDAAMQRVGEELATVHPAVTREFGITNMQTRVGLSRTEALRNMGKRTTNASLTSLAALINQADRFGTSIATALRVHADSIRVARQTKAEEMAAKSLVKMSFPLVLFIFPATFLILMGPVMIELFNSSLMQ